MWVQAIAAHNTNAMAFMYTVPKLEDYSPASLDRAVADLLAALRSEITQLLIEAIRSRKAGQPAANPTAFRDRWLARKSGVLAQVTDLWLRTAPSDARRQVGLRVNEVKPEIERLVEEGREGARLLATISDESLGEVREDLETEELLRIVSRAEPEADRIDVTLPGIRRPLGAEHPVLRTMDEIVGVFRAMGYSVSEGPEIETDYYNFEALNFPPNHPARDSQDTLFVAGQESKPLRERLLLRTHTSPMQIRVMEKQPPPVRIVVPGKVYRHDTPDASHSPLFHQVEGFAVDTNITFSDLKGTLDHAMKALFGSSVKTRFFPSFFPFTEPSADVAVTCFKCNGKGRIGEAPCRVCKQSGWIELLGSGMIDPAVFGFVRKNGYDPEKVSGFAFGMGVDRIAMMKYEIDDISLLFQGDVRFLEQFA